MAEEEDTTMILDDDAVDEERMMYGHGSMTEEELNEKYPNRPHNHSKTLPFSALHLTLFNPLNDNKKKPSGPSIARSKVGPHGPARQSPNEIRKQIIERFISRWRKEVGNDVFPAFRLIIPEKDRDRAMYGLKESALGKLLVKVMKIDKNSEDGYNLLHWKLPGLKASSAMAGDFAGRCYEVISKRPMRTSPGDLTIAQVNERLDRLSVAQKEENQLPIMEEFYKRMNAEELMWLIRMILRQMKIGATEKTILELWHQDAENLFNISSSLRRVCWELYDPEVRLAGDDRGIHLMQCFQPQLAAFQMRSMEQMVTRMKPTEEDHVFWIEEKLDGERMQLHMIEDEKKPGGKRFGFWSRKAKDYTYLYGSSLEDENSALTRHLNDAFVEGVRNIILDGEMITWDPKVDAVIPFGHLKTAAISEQSNPYSDGIRPLFKVFDCLYLNGIDLTRYTLRKRREALSKSVHTIHRRIEVHDYVEAQHASEIEPVLRRVVAEASEGLVLKSPRSAYKLNERNDDWIKVKPEYMTEFGEALDCVVIGGYYGSGKRGGGLSSFLCGLRVNQEAINKGADPQKCYSFFKVGGGFAAADYADLRHRTENKWIDWDPKRPPRHLIILGGGERQFERPDVWIRPEDSVVLEVKAASVTPTEQFGTMYTLRFPRFKRLRTDKDWTQALSVTDFLALKARAEEEAKEKEFKIDDARRQRKAVRRKRPMLVQGQQNNVKTPYAGPASKTFEGMSFFVLSDAPKPLKKSKAEIEQLIKANGGHVVASEKDTSTILISDRNVVKVASLVKRGEREIIRPSWLFDCVRQTEADIGRPRLLLPLEPQNLFFTPTGEENKYDENVDEYGDGYARDLTESQLREVLAKMPNEPDDDADIHVEALMDDGLGEEIPGFVFNGLTAYFETGLEYYERYFAFERGTVASSSQADGLTHIVTQDGTGSIRQLRRDAAQSRYTPRIVSARWVSDCWHEKTRLDEERYAPV